MLAIRAGDRKSTSLTSSHQCETRITTISHSVEQLGVRLDPQRNSRRVGGGGEWDFDARDLAELNRTLRLLHPAVADRDHIPPGDAGGEADYGAVDPIIGEEGLPRKDRRGESTRDARDPAGFVPAYRLEQDRKSVV